MKLKTLIVGVSMLVSAFSFGQHLPTDSTEVDVSLGNEVQLFAPNAFTPDGDFYNDTWKVFIEGNDIYDFHLSIYDRSGQMIWESFNSAGEWDGEFGGHPAPNGVYAYIIETKDDSSDKMFQFTGFITVLR